MSLIKDIKTIVKSDEMQRKLDKLTTGKTPDEKPDITGYRASSYQTGTGSKSTGSNSNGPPADGVDGSGAVVAPSQSQAGSSGPTTNTNNSSTVYNDTGLNNASNFGYSGTGGGQSSSTTNMSGNTFGTGSQGGVQTVAQAGANESSLQATLDGIDALPGLTTDQKTEIKDNTTREYMIENGNIESGYYTAKEIADEKSYVPKADNPSLPAGTSSTTDLDQRNQIKGIVAFDVDGETNEDSSIKAVQVGLEKYEVGQDELYYPSVEGWDDPNTPPIDPTYTEGRIWFSRDGDNNDVFSASFGGIETAIGRTAYGTDDIIGAPSNYIVHNKPAIVTNYAALYSVNAGGSLGDRFGIISAGLLRFIIGESEVESVDSLADVVAHVTCAAAAAAGETTICSQPPPLLENEWTVTNAYYLASVAGKFVSSVYDSVVPLKWRQEVSSVDVALGDGVNVIDTRIMSIEQSSTGGNVLTVKESNGDFIKAFLLDSTNVPVARTEVEGDALNWKPPGSD